MLNFLGIGIVFAQEIDNPLEGISTVPEFIAAITQYLTIICAILSVIGLIIAGIIFVTSGGSPEKIKRAREAIKYSVIGIAVAGLSGVIWWAVGLTGAITMLVPVANAQAVSTTASSTFLIHFENPFVGVGGSVTAILHALLNFIFEIMIVLSPVIMLFSGIQFVTSGGDPEKAAKAKRTVLYGAIGVGIALLALGLAAVVTPLIS